MKSHKVRLPYSMGEKMIIVSSATIITLIVFAGILWGFFGHVAR